MKAVHIYCKNLENVGKYKEENKYHLYLSSPFEKIYFLIPKMNYFCLQNSGRANS